MQLAKLKKLVFPMMILGVIVASFGGFVPTQTTPPNGFGQPSIADVSGSTIRIGKMIYDQSLSGLNGLAIEGINSVDGETNVTDLLMAGTSGSGTWRGLLGYEAEYSNSLPILSSENDDSVMDMVRYEDPNDHNVDVIFIERGSEDGRMVRQRGVDVSYSDGIEAYPEVAVNFVGAPLVSMCLGYFADGDAEIDTAAISDTGKVVGMASMSSGGGQVFLDLGLHFDSDYRFTKNTIAAIDDLDGLNTDTQDLIMGIGGSIYAISGNYSQSTALIWETSIGGAVGSVLPIPDISADGYDDVVVVSSSGIYLLEGKNGTQIWSNTTLGGYFRDVQQFTDINEDGVREIITGNSDGEVFIMDINPNSPEFGTILVPTTNIGYRYIGAILEIGDLNDNGKNEYAIGGDGVVGVLLDNGTKYWTGAARWQADIFSESFQVWDIALLDDRDGDGERDFVAIGGIDGEGGISMYSAQGQFTFLPDLSANGISIDTNCSTVDHEFTYQISAVQVNNLTIEISVFIDGVEHEMIPQAELIWDEGVVFQYSTTLDEGTHEYYFIVTDTSGNELRTPLTGVYNGPTVGDDCDTTEPTTGPGISALPAAQLSVAFISIGIIVMVIKKKFR